MKNLLLLFILVAFGLTSSAVTITAVATGNWNDGTTWDSNPNIPTEFDDIIIPSSYTVTIQSGINAVAFSVKVDGNLNVNGTLTLTPVVTSPTGEIWMDRNLGASQVALTSDDALAYGGWYQWGRFTEGHESRTSGVNTNYPTGVSTAVPGDGSNPWDHEFIAVNDASPRNWLSDLNDALWQGVSGQNNPCPAGFRIPTKDEWDAERQSWARNDAAGAFGSPLKLTVGGYRAFTNGAEIQVGSWGLYWSSTVDGVNGEFIDYLSFDGNSSTIAVEGRRATGESVRCIKD